jgi:hypothetical protein
MKTFIKAITITIVLTLIPAGSTTAQTTPDPAPAPAGPQAVSTVDDTLASVRDKLIQLNIATTGQYDGGRVLVIPTAEIQLQDLVTMMEDMTVMCRIFDQRLEQSNLVSGRFTTGSRIRFSTPFSWDSRSTGAMYIQGYGALFLTKVDFLLSPPLKAPEEKETEEEDTDPLWTQMRQQIYAPEEVGRGRSTGERPEEKYDAEKVEELKETLIKTLKHAANIRNLKPDESVVLTVIGKAGQPAASTIERFYGEDYSRYIASTRGGTGVSSPTVLTIRAKKADIDAFAEGQLSFDQFTEKTQLLSYSYLGENVGEPPRSSSTDIFYRGRSSGSSRDRRR